MSRSAQAPGGRIPNAFVNDNDSGNDNDNDGDNDSGSKLHQHIVELRHEQERVAQREQNRTGPIPDIPVHVRGIGGELANGTETHSAPAVPRVGAGTVHSAPGALRQTTATAGLPPRSGGGSVVGRKGKTPAGNVSRSELKHWFRRCRRKHMSTMTPEQQERMKRNVALQNKEQRKHRYVRKAKKMAYASANARANVMSSISSYSPNYAPLTPQQQRAAVDSASAQMQMLQHVQASHLSDSESEDDIERMDAEGESAAAAVNDNQMNKLLNELRKEPNNDVEREDKFKIYEQYLAVVSRSREECLKLHDVCKDDLKEHSNVLRKMGKAIKSIDSEHNSSINWDSLGNRWFVYDMTKKSDRNNTFILNVFKGLKRDLEMIQNLDMDCPICLDNLKTVPSGVRVLHCCHKLCGDCYSHWQAACRGGVLICPLCRQRDFQQAVVTRAPRMVQQYLHDMASDSEDSDTDDEAPVQAATTNAAAPAAAPAVASSGPDQP